MHIGEFKELLKFVMELLADISFGLHFQAPNLRVTSLLEIPKTYSYFKKKKKKKVHHLENTMRTMDDLYLEGH